MNLKIVLISLFVLVSCQTTNLDYTDYADVNRKIACVASLLNYETPNSLPKFKYLTLEQIQIEFYEDLIIPVGGDQKTILAYYDVNTIVLPIDYTGNLDLLVHELTHYVQHYYDSPLSFIGREAQAQWVEMHYEEKCNI